MINLLIALGAGLLVVGLVKALGFSLIAGIIPGTIVFLAVFVVLGRRSFTQLQAIVAAVQAELSGMSPNKKDQIARSEKAIKMLEASLPLGRWQFLIEGEIYGQIGMIKHLFKDADGALAAFKKSSARNYFAKAMQGAIYFQKKDFAAMKESFEGAVKYGNKEGLT